MHHRIHTRSVIVLSLTIAFVLLTSFSRRTRTDKDDWKLGTDKDGIKVYTRKSEQGKIRTSRAEMFLPITVDQAITVISDFSAYAGWFPSCKDAKVLKRMGDGDFMAILIYKTPWPFPNMDCVERLTIEKHGGRDTSFVHVKATPTYVPETKGIVRVKEMQASWQVIPMNGGTYVINEYYTDMGGIIPAWLANTQAVEIPFNIFSGMKQRVNDLYRKK